MDLKPQVGRPEKLLQADKIDLIVEGFGKTFAIRRAAGHAHESPYHIRKWLLQGEQDVLNELDTINAQLFLKVAHRLSEKAAEYIAKLETCPNNAGSLTWLMEKCLRDDYGQDSEEYKELVDLYKKLLESYRRLQESNPLHGVRNDGREMDSKGD